MSRVSTAIIIPVKDGMPLLAEVIAACERQQPDEFLIVDSGSTDGSLKVANTSAARVIEIPPSEFGHGRTRNLAAAETTAEIICFLTQDATPIDGWLDAYRLAFASDHRIGCAFGPHLPRPDTSPMIARELLEFFGPFSPSGQVTVQSRIDAPGWNPGFLSNANAAYRRSALEAVGFRDLPYAEDQAFARDAFAAGWSKAYVPAAGALHAHNYGWFSFMRRYFDEYRGLHQATGYRKSFYPRGMVRMTLTQARADRGWLRRRPGTSTAQRELWTARSLLHHGGRQVAELLGGRAEQLPQPLRKAMSLERRGDGAAAARAPSAPARVVDEPGAIEGEVVAPAPYSSPYKFVADVECGGVVALDRSRLPSATEPLRIAVIVPGFRPGSGGHSSIFNLIEQLEERGHRTSIWLHDPHRTHGDSSADQIERDIHRHFRPLKAAFHRGFGDWNGADVVLATGWDTVYVALRMPGVGARAYLVQDHEPEFFPTSAERLWAERSYKYGLYPICLGSWLRQIMERRYGLEATHFEYGIDSKVYRPLPEVERRDDTIVVYSRLETARRAGPLVAHALEELVRRRSGVRVVTFGSNKAARLAFPHRHAGLLKPAQLATLYNEGTIGLTLSLTNYSLTPPEMMACGLPVVDVAGFSSEVVYGQEPPLDLCEPTVPAIATALERLLDDPALRAEYAAAGLDYATSTTAAAADVLETGLRRAIAIGAGDVIKA